MGNTFNNNLAWKIKVTFKSFLPPKSYITPDIRNNNPGWDSELFKRDIERLEFFIPTGDTLIMSGMEKYNFFIEATKNLSGGKAGKVQIESFVFCGKIPGTNTVEMWIVKDKEITRMRTTWGKEYKGSHTRGWKNGVPNKPVSMII